MNTIEAVDKLQDLLKDLSREHAAQSDEWLERESVISENYDSAYREALSNGEFDSEYERRVSSELEDDITALQGEYSTIFTDEREALIAEYTPFFPNLKSQPEVIQKILNPDFFNSEWYGYDNSGLGGTDLGFIAHYTYPEYVNELGALYEQLLESNSTATRSYKSDRFPETVEYYMGIIDYDTFNGIVWAASDIAHYLIDSGNLEGDFESAVIEILNTYGLNDTNDGFAVLGKLGETIPSDSKIKNDSEWKSASSHARTFSTDISIHRSIMLISNGLKSLEKCGISFEKKPTRSEMARAALDLMPNIWDKEVDFSEEEFELGEQITSAILDVRLGYTGLGLALSGIYRMLKFLEKFTGYN